MRIQHNIMAMNTHRQLGINNLNQTKSTEKLSSGFRINRAADDAAGLTISEKMRAQIRGLGQASANAQDGISLIQAAEGALQETHSILQRMRELSVKAANDINETEDRDAIKSEMDALTAEVDRIAKTTEFNKKTLLDGSLTDGAYVAGKTDTDKVLSSYAVGDMSKLTAGAMTITSGAVTVAADDVTAKAAESEYTITSATTSTLAEDDTVKFKVGGVELETAALSANDTAGTIATAMKTAFDAYVAANGTSPLADVTFAVTTDKITITAGTEGAAGNALVVLSDISVNGTGALGAGMPATPVKATSNSTDGVDGVTKGDIVMADATVGSDSAVKMTYDAATKTFSGTSSAATGAVTVTFAYEPDDTGAQAAKTATLTVATGTALTLQVGANSGADQTIKISVESISSAGLGIDTLAVNDHPSAQAAIDAIENAIQKVSTQRSGLGAVQNRLEHTVANLDTVAENIQAAESRIRDVDMAKEMMTFTKNNILNQASTAMLAQANQAPQTVLQLLQ